ncbi:MAG: hypothetical protein LC098_04055 [Burkholderiales bacterium]|nr:hypothetical protein [Burkholderiales bacterium]
MPRGERSGDVDVLAKRAATYTRKRMAAAQIAAERLIRRCIADCADAQACAAWLAARNVALNDPTLQPRDRRRWLMRAKRAMLIP